MTRPEPRRRGPATVDELAALVLAVPGVAGLHAGPFDGVTTRLLRRGVAGLRRSPAAVEVHLVLAAGHPAQAVVQQVHAVVAARVDVPVRVHVRDVLDAG